LINVVTEEFCGGTIEQFGYDGRADDNDDCFFVDY
jgi:hypothetical protein